MRGQRWELRLARVGDCPGELASLLTGALRKGGLDASRPPQGLHLAPGSPSPLIGLR